MDCKPESIMRQLSNVVGIDDAPFARESEDRVPIVGAVFAGRRFDGVLIGSVERDGSDATAAIAETIRASRFYEHIQAVLLQGIAVAGFNVIDLQRLHDELGRPLLVVARRAPDLDRIRETLLTHVRDGARKWQLIEAAGVMEPLAGVFVQRTGMTRSQALSLIERLALHGRIPEPLRVAHLIAGALVRGASRGRA
jgi:endonuclease V-like protein UPF0215 family